MRSTSTNFKILFSSLAIIFCFTANAQHKSLKEAAEKWQKAMDLKNAELVVASFDTSIIAIYHSNPIAHGKEANLTIWQHQFNDSLDQHPITTDKVDVSASGDLGYVYGKWWSIHPRENYFNGGRYVAIWKLINKQWRMVMLSANVQEDVKKERQLK